MATGEWIDLLVGTYTDQGSRGIYALHFNQTTGEALTVDSLTVPHPSFLAISPDGHHLYAISEVQGKDAPIHVIDIGGQAMRHVQSVPTEAGDPCYIATDGRWLVTGNYSGSMSVYTLSDGGACARLVNVFAGAVGGSDAHRQSTPHVHCAEFTPDGRFILATDFSADRILAYRIEDGKVVETGIAAVVAPGSGPRHITFGNDGQRAYLMSELSGMVTVFAYHDGHLEQLQVIESDHARARGGADIHLSPDGHFLYSSNRLQDDGIAIFAIDATTGLLSDVGYQPTGLHPRHFNISPNGKYLLCACRDENKIQVFARNEDNGLLTDTHQDIAISRPVCVQFK
ncbi:MAG: lactonase family protein [Muribaculaceae bacterium]|nr:lactonase family protein [Muribaculaceae bacterium]